MPHIHTKKGDHDLTVSAVIVRLDSSEPKVILHKHKKLGVYLQFGGHVETNENPWQAIVHELKEESGYDINQLKILQPKVRLDELTNSKIHPQPIAINTHPFDSEMNHFHSDITYAFTAEQPPKDKPDVNESQDIRLFSLKELRNLKSQEIFDDVRTIHSFILENLTNWQALPTKQYN